MVPWKTYKYLYLSKHDQSVMYLKLGKNSTDLEMKSVTEMSLTGVLNNSSLTHLFLNDNFIPYICIFSNFIVSVQTSDIQETIKTS